MFLDEIFDTLYLAKFKFEFMASMIRCGRDEEAEKAYEEGIKYLYKMLDNVDREKKAQQDFELQLHLAISRGEKYLVNMLRKSIADNTEGE